MKVVVNSIPKSGTHLLVRLFELLGYSESKLHLSGSLVRYSKNPIHNYSVRRRRGSGYSVDLDDLNNQIDSDKLEFLVNKKIKKDEFSEAHLPYSNKLARYLCNEVKVVYITRDPRAIVASHIAHAYKVKNYPLRSVFDKCNDDDKIRIILDGYKSVNYKLLPIRERIMNSIGWINSEGVCHTTFESLIGPQGGGDKIAQYDSVKKIMDFVGYKEAREIEEIADKLFYSKAETFNKGSVDSWRTVLNERQIEVLNSELSEVVALMGYLK